MNERFSGSAELPLLDEVPPLVAERVEALADCYLDILQAGEEPDSRAIGAYLHQRLALVDLVYRAGQDSFAGASSAPGHHSPTQREPLPSQSFSDAATMPPRSLAALAPLSDDWPLLPGYEILEELGRGGMGIVYKARQVGLNRLVALKMILAGPQATPEHLARFRKEAEAVARFQHPHIVTIHEVGEHAGRPYFSLEFVAGGSLADLLHGQPRPATEAARLLETLARTIHSAHQHGLVHLDLKPANILLVSGGVVSGEWWDGARNTTHHSLQTTHHSPLTTHQPKIADFGLARSREEMAGGAEDGPVGGTPSYMAPEQVEGKMADIGPAADVYALGAILYETLTGRPPYRAATAMETILQVLAGDSAPPSRLIPQVPRDLETICLKCLSRDVRKRYAGADALAEDLRRFQEGKPIRARPVGRAERLLKWSKRQPVVASLIALVVLVSALGFGLVLWKWREAEHAWKEEERRAHAEREAKGEAVGERKRAESNAAEARRQRDRYRTSYQHNLRAARDLTEISEKALDPGLDIQVVRKSILAAVVKYYRDFIEQRPDDPALLAELAYAYRRVALTTSEIGSSEEALRAYAKAVGILRDLIAKKPEELEIKNDLAALYNNMSILHRHAGRNEKAKDFNRQARGLRELLVLKKPASKAYQSNLAATYNNLAADMEKGRIEQAEYYYKALAIRKKLAVDDDAMEVQELARVHNNLGVYHFHRREPAPAFEHYLKALELRRQLAKAHPRNRTYRYELAQAHYNLGITWRKSNQADKARAAQREARTILDDLVARFPRALAYHSLLAESWQEIGFLANDISEETKAFEKAVAHQRLAFLRSGGLLSYRRLLSKYYLNLALSQLNQGRPADARGNIQEVDKLWPNDSESLYQYARQLASTIPQVGKGKSELTPQEKAERRHFGDLAMALLQNAVAKGFKDGKRLRGDAGFEPLRQREDYKALANTLVAIPEKER